MLPTMPVKIIACLNLYWRTVCNSGVRCPQVVGLKPRRNLNPTTLASTSESQLHSPRYRKAKMPPTSIEQLIPELRDAIGPVILISGVGLLLLTMTNRLGRAIDRARLLKRELPGRTGHEREQTLAQVAIIYRRARMIRVSILLAAISVLLASALIITLFVTALLQWQQGALAGLIFIGSMVSLFGSMIAFIWDINLSLHALKLELETVQNNPD
jgi:Protein of unknown function (DUF2721)